MTEQFATDAGVAAWIRRHVAHLTDTDVYAPGPDGDVNLIDDFQQVINDYARGRERASLARIRAAYAADAEERRRRAIPERDVSLPWLGRG